MNNSSLPDVDQGSCWLFSSTFFTTLLVVVSLAAFVGNILVVIVVFKTPILRTSTNFYYVNMAVSDFLGALFTWPVYLTHEIITSKGSLLHGTLASAGCKTGAYIRLLSYLVSILSMVLIAVERYIAIVHPLKVILLTRKKRAALIFAAWLIPITYSVPHIFYFEVEEVDQIAFCRFSWNPLAIMIFYATTFLVFFVVPLTSITVHYTVIVRALKKAIPSDDANQNSFQKKRYMHSQNIMRLYKSIVTVFVGCYLLYTVFLIMKATVPKLFLKDECKWMLGIFYFMLPLLSSTVNPFILFLFSTNFRQALQTLCPFSCPKFCIKVRRGTVRSYRVSFSPKEATGTT